MSYIGKLMTHNEMQTFLPSIPYVHQKSLKSERHVTNYILAW